MKKAIFITPLDPWGDSRGGTVTFAKHLIQSFRDSLVVVSHCNDKEIPVGEWKSREFEGVDIPFYNLGRISKKIMPLIPKRITTYYNVRKHIKYIRKIGVMNLLIDSPETAFAIQHFKWDSICYSFSGVNNAVSNSRYKWARIFGNYYEKKHISILNKIDPEAMIASADNRSIEEFHARTGFVLKMKNFHQFPTRVDTDVFYPAEKEYARSKLGISGDAIILVVTGRLCWIKGWNLVLEAFSQILSKYPNSKLIFVGDGEDRTKLLTSARALGISEQIKITGFVAQATVAFYLNAADVCLVGSYREGWSLAMCEILACGKPIVSTNVSGAKDMVHNGANGYIVEGRNPQAFASAVCRTLELQGAGTYSLLLSNKYALKNMSSDLLSIWSPLRG